MIAKIIEIGLKLNGNRYFANTFLDTLEFLIFFFQEIRRRCLRQVILQKLQFAIPIENPPPHAPIVKDRYEAKEREDDADHRQEQDERAIKQRCQPERQRTLEESWAGFVDTARVVRHREFRVIRQRVCPNRKKPRLASGLQGRPALYGKDTLGEYSNERRMEVVTN